MEANLKLVRDQIKEAADKFAQQNGKITVTLPRLIAVSKTKPVEIIEKAYSIGQRHFGENYVQELINKSKYFKEKGGFEDIRWHFIGHLQKNKVNNLCSVSNLEMVETVESSKIADALNRSWCHVASNRLKIMIQINTSLEESKKGCCSMDHCCELVEHIQTNCPNLQLVGLMTVGAPGHQYEKGSNPDFEHLCSCRKKVCDTFGWKVEDIELSMGMSADFVEAILAGSTNVRVGSTIFGKRCYAPDKTNNQFNSA